MGMRQKSLNRGGEADTTTTLYLEIFVGWMDHKITIESDRCLEEFSAAAALI